MGRYAAIGNACEPSSRHGRTVASHRDKLEVLDADFLSSLALATALQM